MARDICDKVFLLTRRAAEHIPETLCLDEIVVVYFLEKLVDSSTRPALVCHGGLDRLVGQLSVRAGIVGVGTVVAIDGHGAITLEGVECLERSIDRNLLIVGSKTVTMGIRVRKESGLEDRVDGGLNTRHQVRRRKGNLLNLGKVVFRVLVEGEFAKLPEGHVLLWPDLGQVKDVPAELFGFLRCKHLNVDGPAGVLSLLDGLEKILSVPVGVLSRHLGGFFSSKRLVALISLEVDLGIDK